MLKLYPLYSGSSGNMYLIKSPTATILVDIGVSFKALKDALENLSMDVSDITALFITHEHSDHIKGLSTFINKTDIPIYTSKKTFEYIKNKINVKKEPNVHFVQAEIPINILDTVITPFSISHDAVEPLGYKVQNNDSTLCIATDLGYVSDDVYKHLLDAKLSVIESNYDRNLLMYGSYSYPLKCRIQSDIGHLSNDDTTDTILALARAGKRDFILGHLSINNNEPEQAIFSVTHTLKQNGFNLDDFNINLATRDLSLEVYEL